jgi:nitroimidazol reductase NimA-like FMN-containing flavoprotein (pyridoxamine 5'-phosphate oxidase superfamily)
MKYNNNNVRRRERLLEEPDAIELLRTGEYGVLSMVENRDNYLSGYGLPINYVWDGEHSIYFHCTPEGHKLKCLSANAKVSFCVVGRTNVISHKFTTAYESIILRGTVYMDLPDAERLSALHLLLGKYSPEDIETGKKYTEKSFHRTQIIRLDVEEFSGKTKRVNP